jgi:hypothetical protein
MTEAEKLAAHVIDLCHQHRKTWRVQGRGRAFPRIGIFDSPEVKGQVTYFLALHELAHCVLRHHSTKLCRLEQEAEAWRWALDNCCKDPTTATARQIYRRLVRSYLRNYVMKNLRLGKTVRKIPEADSFFWHVCDVIATWAEIPENQWEHLSLEARSA